MTQSWIKAGLIGGVVGIIISLPAYAIYFLPIEFSIIALCACIPLITVFPASGVLAVRALKVPYNFRDAAINGALAGLLAASIVAIISFGLNILTLDLTQKYIQQQYTPEMLERLNQTGLGVLSSSGGQMVQSICCGIATPIIGAALGSIAAIIYAAFGNRTSSQASH